MSDIRRHFRNDLVAIGSIGAELRQIFANIPVHLDHFSIDGSKGATAGFIDDSQDLLKVGNGELFSGHSLLPGKKVRGDLLMRIGGIRGERNIFPRSMLEAGSPLREVAGKVASDGKGTDDRYNLLM